MLQSLVAEEAIGLMSLFRADQREKFGRILASIGSPTLGHSGFLYKIKYALPSTSSPRSLALSAVASGRSGQIGLLRKPIQSLMEATDTQEVVETLPAYLIITLGLLTHDADDASLRELADVTLAILQLVKTGNPSTRLAAEERRCFRDIIMAITSVGSLLRVSSNFSAEKPDAPQRVRRYMELLSSVCRELVKQFPDIDGLSSLPKSDEYSETSPDLAASNPNIYSEKHHFEPFLNDAPSENDDLLKPVEGWSSDWQDLHEAVTVLHPRILADANRQNWGDFFHGVNRSLCSLVTISCPHEKALQLANSELLKSFVLAIPPGELMKMTFEDLGVNLSTGVWRRWAPARSDSYSRGPNLTPLHERTEDWVNLSIPSILRENLDQLVQLGVIGQEFSFADFCSSNALNPIDVLEKRKKDISDEYYMPCLGFDQFREQLPLYATAKNWSLSEVYWCTCRPNHKAPVGDHYEEGEDRALSLKYEALVRWYFEGRN